MKVNIFFCLLVGIVFSGLVRAEEAYDTVIRNARILDGAGNPVFIGDVAINGERITKVGLVDGAGRREIDATGKHLSPGWIDMMDQSGRIFQTIGYAPNKINMGVTTVISGEAGTPVPADEINEYFTAMQKNGISVNFATYYSATQARVAVMGDKAGKPTPEQLEQMKSLIRKAMKAGAMGITTALIYPPSAYHSTSELIELAKVAAEYGGIYATHMRDESANFIAAVEEAIRIGEEARISVEIFHLKAAYAPNWTKDMPKALNLIEQAQSRGVNIAADLYPYTGAGTGLEVTTQLWLFEDGEKQAIEKLKDPAVRLTLKQEIKRGWRGGWTNMVNAAGGWQNIVLANSHLPAYEQFHGKNFIEIGEALKGDPADIAWDLMITAYPKRPVAIYFMMHEDDLRLAMRKPWVSIGSDAASSRKAGEIDELGLPHPRSYATFPRIIAEYVRKQKILTLPDAIRKMTSWPATRMGLKDRGLIKEGMKADITIFDFQTIEDTANWLNPFSKPNGIEYVLVNGVVVLDKGEHTQSTSGQILKGQGYLKRLR